eukprot:SAG31_NODE_16554_length_704_cov_1.244628_1_plen_151_part_10
MPQEPPRPAPASIPFNVLWQVKAQEEQELYRDYALGGSGHFDGERSQLLFEKELRKLNQSRVRRVMGRREQGKGIQNSDVEQARLRVQAAVERARHRDKVLQEAAILKAHTHDPGAGTRPVPKVGRRAPPGGIAVQPAAAVSGARPTGPIE